MNEHGMFQAITDPCVAVSEKWFHNLSSWNILYYMQNKFSGFSTQIFTYIILIGALFLSILQGAMQIFKNYSWKMIGSSLNITKTNITELGKGFGHPLALKKVTN